MELIDERRVKALMIPTEHIISILAGLEYKNIIQFKTLPDGYKVLSVHHDFRTNAFHFTIWHESFDPLVEGAVMPIIDNMFYSLKEYIPPEV